MLQCLQKILKVGQIMANNLFQSGPNLETNSLFKLKGEFFVLDVHKVKLDDKIQCSIIFRQVRLRHFWGNRL